MPNQTRISVVIPCRNEEKYIERCISSVLASNYPKELFDIFPEEMITFESKH